MIQPMVVPARAYYDKGRLIFEGEYTLNDALEDGCFFLRQPEGLNLEPGKILAQNFYNEPDGTAHDPYRSLHRQGGIYFDREHFQTEHLLMNRLQRVNLLPRDVIDMCDDMSFLGRNVLHDILKVLQVPRENWDKATAECLKGKAVEWMSVSHYRSDRRLLGCPAHKDTGFITILYFDQSGLQVCRDGIWYNIAPVPGYFLVNFGSALERLTKQLDISIEAVMHRVHECPLAPNSEERFSFATFINPAASAMLCELSKDGSVHEVERVEDFLRKFNATTWKDDHDDFGISAKSDHQDRMMDNIHKDNTAALAVVKHPNSSAAKLGPVPYPGVIAHHVATPQQPDHYPGFTAATQQQGLDPSSYFKCAGVTDFARQNEGVCTFWFGSKLVLYQVTNQALVRDEDLGPSIDTTAEMFGNFMATRPAGHPERRPKRILVERMLGSVRQFEKMVPAILPLLRDKLTAQCEIPCSVDTFTLGLIADIASVVPGVLDLTECPLSEYLESKTYGPIARSFFEIASKALGNVDLDAIKDDELIVGFTRQVLLDNAKSIGIAPESNLIRAHLAIYGLPFVPEQVSLLPASVLKELGTLIIASYDTTALSLTWTLALLGAYPEQASQLSKMLLSEPNAASAVIEKTVLEAVRLGGSNPTALWRRVVQPTKIKVRNTQVILPKDTMLWLDRHAANRDPNIFPNPDQFDLTNVDAIAGHNHGQKLSPTLLSRNRYEINSFSMVNTYRNPRKCPGRIFSIELQALILREIFSAYRVEILGVELKLATHSSMPRPQAPGTILLFPN